MKSMTGFARREIQTDEHYLMVEIKCYNNRYLDINVTLPGSLSPKESVVRGHIGGTIRRGKVECTIRYRSLAQGPLFEFDPIAVDALVESLRALKQRAGVAEPIHLSHILRYDEHIRSEHRIDVDEAWRRIEPELVRALCELDAERLREGESTAAALATHRETVGSVLSLFEREARRLGQLIRDQVRERFDEVLGTRIDEDRMLAEIGALLVKFSIDEEISRLHGHLDAFDTALLSSEPIGKKLDFLCQELNREINTIGSKSPIYEINERVVEAKDAIEKMREQLRNIE